MSDPTRFVFWFKGDSEGRTSYEVLRSLAQAIKEILQKTPAEGEIQYELKIELVRLPVPPAEIYANEPRSRDMGIVDYEEAGAARFFAEYDEDDEEDEE